MACETNNQPPEEIMKREVFVGLRPVYDIPLNDVPKPTFTLFNGRYVFDGQRFEIPRETVRSPLALLKVLAKAEEEWPDSRMYLVSPSPNRDPERDPTSFLLVMNQSLPFVFYRDLLNADYRVCSGSAAKIVGEFFDAKEPTP
jgi:hypothetical protein